MKAQTLTINYTDLNTNENRDILILASNPFMLVIKYLKFVNTYIHVNAYTLINNVGESGNNHPINSGAYLHCLVEEISGQELN
tara:strand:- start:922 stop:1170 length:249 start_codon:yes stop_codon:yes gene_type:complete